VACGWFTPLKSAAEVCEVRTSTEANEFKLDAKTTDAKKHMSGFINSPFFVSSFPQKQEQRAT
jgi:hypothetical protein